MSWLIPDPGYIYVIQAVGQDYYKIGKSINPANRLKTFHAKLPFKIEYTTIVAVRYYSRTERALHEKFSDKRVDGEWFYLLTEEDIAYIESLGEVYLENEIPEQHPEIEWEEEVELVEPPASHNNSRAIVDDKPALSATEAIPIWLSKDGDSWYIWREYCHWQWGFWDDECAILPYRMSRQELDQYYVLTQLQDGQRYEAAYSTFSISYNDIWNCISEAFSPKLTMYEISLPLPWERRHKNKHPIPKAPEIPSIEPVTPVFIEGGIILSTWKENGQYWGCKENDMSGLLLDKVQLTEEQYNQAQEWERYTYILRLERQHYE